MTSRKLLDTVEHEPLWEVLSQFGVPSHYIRLLRSIYADQMAFVQTSVRSRRFSVQRGVRQGDPISALLFIAVRQSCFDGLHAKWVLLNHRRRGTKLGMNMGGSQRSLFELRFADDVMLFAQHAGDIIKMLNHLVEASAKFGLSIDFQKTKVLTSSWWSGGRRQIRVGDTEVAVLVGHAREKYLGRMVCFSDPHQAELEHRISAAWAAFHVHKGELCNRAYGVQSRARLFTAVVTPVMLYGSDVWALTASQEKRVYTTWRRMMRYVFCIHRRSLDGEKEPWIDFLQRAAAHVEALAANLNLESWLLAHRRGKRRFARRVATCTDSRWSQELLEWTPHGDGRDQGRPKTRWSDAIEKTAGGKWLEVAKNSLHWDALEDGFVEGL